MDGDKEKYGESCTVKRRFEQNEKFILNNWHYEIVALSSRLAIGQTLSQDPKWSRNSLKEVSWTLA